MAGSITHAFVSAIADGADTTLVRPQTNWNANHVFSLGLTDITDSTTAGWLGHGRPNPAVSPSYVNIAWNVFEVLGPNIPAVALNMVMQLGGW